MVTSSNKSQTRSALGSVPQLLLAFVAALRIPDLRNRILFTLGALILFRFMAHITVPGVNLAAFQDVFNNNAFLGFFNIFSGGALQNLSIASLGVFPYITASIIIQIMTPVIPRMRELSQEGESGRAKLTRYTHYLTIPLAIAYAFGQFRLLSTSFGNNSITGFGFGAGGDALNTLSIIALVVASTMFLVWLGDLITEKGIGNGISLIIFAGIVASIPAIASQLWLLVGQNQTFQVILLVAIILVILYFVVFVTEAQRRIPVQYGRSVFRSGRMYRQTGASYIPLRINAAGMIPLIFAFAVISLPSVLASFFFNPASDSFISNAAFWITNNFGPTSWPYWVLLFVIVVIFAFVYTFIVYLQQNIAENLQKNSGFIPGIRPGEPTRNYLNSIIFRITWAGALFLGLVAISPWIAELITNVSSSTTLIQSTSLLIMVGVALDTLRQLEAQLMMRNYQDFAA